MFTTKNLGKNLTRQDCNSFILLVLYTLLITRLGSFGPGFLGVRQQVFYVLAFLQFLLNFDVTNQTLVKGKALS